MLASRLLRTDDIKPLNAPEFWKLCDLVALPGALLGSNENELAHQGVPPELAQRIVRLFERSTAMAVEIDQLDQSGISTITSFDPSYHRRLVEKLGAKAPPLLYVAGDTSLLDKTGLGVVGSRDVSAQGGEAAEAAAERASGLGLPVVLGGARGVDQLAMSAALQSDGSVIGFLADSLLRAVRKADIRSAIHGGTALMCTPYNPNAGFSAGNAMGRNKLIYASANVTFVAASDSGSGGTWAGATEALQNHFGHVCVWRGEGEGPGNSGLVDLGATPCFVDRRHRGVAGGAGGCEATDSQATQRQAALTVLGSAATRPSSAMAPM